MTAQRWRPATEFRSELAAVAPTVETEQEALDVITRLAAPAFPEYAGGRDAFRHVAGDVFSERFGPAWWPALEQHWAKLCAAADRGEVRPRPIEAPGSVRTVNVHTCTDLGNARRLVEEYGQDFRYCAPLGGWFGWDGRRWEHDQTGNIKRAARRTVLARIQAEVEEASDEKDRAELLRWFARSQSKAKLDAMEDLARHEIEVVARAEEFDSDPEALNVANGVLTLDGSAHLLQHDPGRMITKLAPVAYDPAARAPTWDRFLVEIMPDAEARAFLQRAAGLALRGDVLEHAMFVLWGQGKNGKSTFLETLAAVFGDYASAAAPGLLLVHRNDQHPTGMADLRGARFVSTVEPDSGKALAEAVVKQLTGGDTVKARRLYSDFMEFTPSWTIWMATNHKPEVRGQDDGIWRRIKLVPFTVQIPEERQDSDLKAKLIAEGPGILNWALEGLHSYLDEGLGEPLAVTAATSEYRTESDPVGQFLEDATEPGGQFSVPAAALWTAWRVWCEKSGHRPGTQTSFGRSMADRGFEKTRSASARIYVGLRLVGDDEAAWRAE